MTQSKNITYVPGVCNIGPEEIARRRNFGIVGLVATIVLFAALVLTKVNPWWRLFVFFPAAMSATGFIQAQYKFCLGFAKKGIFNFGNLGNMQRVTDKESMSKDRTQANKIMAYSVLTGIIIALIAVAV